MTQIIAATLISLQLGSPLPAEIARIHPDAATGQIDDLGEKDTSIRTTRISLPS